MTRIFSVTTVAFATAAVAFGAPAAPAPRRTPFVVGACTHFGQHKGVLDRNLRRLREAGIDSIRDEISWGGVERERGKLSVPEYDDEFVRAAASAGAAPLIIFDYANRFYDDGDRPRSAEAIEGFTRYAESLVRHFGSSVRLYEVWNEWDIGIGLPDPHRTGGSAEDYVKLLRVVYPCVKAVDPGITVMAGACTSGGVNRGWLEGILREGALEFCDAISVHSYNYSGQGSSKTPEACIEWLGRVGDLCKRYNGGTDVTLYVTEIGWPTQRDKRGTSPALSAAYLARLFLGGRTLPYLRGQWWYDFQDDGWNPTHNEHNFGIVRPDLTPKPAYYALRDVAPLVRDGVFEGKVETDEKELHILRFTLGGEDVWALWSADNAERQVVLHAGFLRDQVSVLEVGRARIRSAWGYRPWARGRGALDRALFSLVVGPTPVLVTGRLAGATVAAVTRLDPDGPLEW